MYFGQSESSDTERLRAVFAMPVRVFKASGPLSWFAQSGLDATHPSRMKKDPRKAAFRLSYWQMTRNAFMASGIAEQASTLPDRFSAVWFGVGLDLMGQDC